MAGEEDSAPTGPIVQAMGFRFAWPTLSESEVKVNQVDMYNGRATRRGEARFSLVHEARPGNGTVALRDISGTNATDVRAFTLGITRDGRLLDPDAAVTKSSRILGDDFGFSSAFIWNVLVEQWNMRDFPEGQPVHTSAVFWDEKLGKASFAVDIVPVGYVSCPNPVSGWCARVRAVYTPDTETMTSIFGQIIERNRARSEEDSVRDATGMEFTFELLLEPETMLPHRVDVAFQSDFLLGPEGRTSLLTIQKKLTMGFAHGSRVTPPPPTGPQDEPRRRLGGGGAKEI